MGQLEGPRVQKLQRKQLTARTAHQAQQGWEQGRQCGCGAGVPREPREQRPHGGPRGRFPTAVLEKTLESPLESKEIKPVNPKGYQS